MDLPCCQGKTMTDVIAAVIASQGRLAISTALIAGRMYDVVGASREPGACKRCGANTGASRMAAGHRPRRTGVEEGMLTTVRI
eukprot:11357128-Heterocapsa_arctica.AAC.1